jgi:tetratricopeptide (TPR) repeat protein
LVIRTGEGIVKSKFVDRRKELSQLKEHVEELLKGNGRLVLIEGEAGVGKTRLIDELSSWVTNQHGQIQFLAGKCIFREGSDPYLPFTDALREFYERENIQKLIGVPLLDQEPMEQFSIEMIPLIAEPPESDSKESSGVLGEELVIKDDKSPGVKDRSASDHDRSKVEPPIGFIPSIIKSTDTEALKLAQDKMFENISDQLINLAKNSPVILFLDDLQWADNSTLKLLHYIAEKTRDSPILIYGVYRPEELQLSEDMKLQHPLAETLQRLSREKLFNSITLERLPQNATESMIKNVLNYDDVPKGFSNWLFEKTEGNPFFIEEVIISLMEEGIIDPQSYLWEPDLDITKLSRIKIPTTIGDLIVRRLNRLDGNDLKILSYASLIGREFDYNVLKRISSLSDDKLLDALDRLAVTGLIHEDLSTEDERYKFDNVMIQDIAYGGLSRARRRLMHKKVGGIIEKFNSDKLGTVVYELAHHYYRGKVWNKAIYYLIRAAEKASNLYALSEAVEYYKFALEGLDRLEHSIYNNQLKIGILENIGSLGQVLGEWGNALNYYQQELKVIDEVNDFVQSKKYKPKKHGKINLNWLELKQVEAYRYIADIYRLESKWKLADKFYRQTLKIAEVVGDINNSAEAHRGMGYVHWRRGEHDKAIEHYDKCIEFGKKLEDQSIVSIVFDELGNIYNYKGEWDKAIKFYNKSIKGLEKLIKVRSQPQRLRLELARAYNNIGDINIKRKQWAKAIKNFEKCEKISSEIGDAHMTAWALFNAGECYAKKMKLDKAFRNSNKALKILSKDDKIGAAATYKVIGITNRFAKNWNESEKYFKDSIDIFRGLDIPYDLAMANFELGLMYKDKGDTNAAKKVFKEALKIFKKLDATKEMEEVNKEL